MGQRTRGIFQRGGVFWISYYFERKRHREKAGTRYNDAIDLLGRRRMEIKEGRFFPPTRGGRLAFRNLGKEALAQKEVWVAASSYQTDVGRFKQLLPICGNVPADRFTSQRVVDTLAVFRRQGKSAATTNRFRSLMSSIFNYGIRCGRIQVNPVKDVKRFKERDRIRFLDQKEERAVRPIICKDPVNEAEIDLALQTGMRRGEQFGLKWKDVDFKRGILRVNGKTGPRVVAANSKARSVLRRIQAITGESEFVCRANDGQVKRDWRRWFEDACKEAGVRDFHWHDLRHTFASRLVMKGTDLRTVQELMGHKDIRMTMRYAHLAPGHAAAAAERLAADDVDGDAESTGTTTGT